MSLEEIKSTDFFVVAFTAIHFIACLITAVFVLENAVHTSAVRYYFVISDGSALFQIKNEKIKR